MMVKEHYSRWKRARAIKKIRREMHLLGMPVNHLSDEDIENNINEICSGLAVAGLMVEEAGKAIERLFDAGAGGGAGNG